MSIDEQFRNPYVTLYAKSEFEEDEAALEALVQLKDLEFGEAFNNKDTQLDSEEGEGLSITFYHDGRPNILRLITTSNSDVSLRLSLGGDHMDKFQDTLNILIDSLEEVKGENLSVYKVYEIPFNALHLPIQGDTDLEVNGIRARVDSGNYIVQSTNNDRTSILFEQDMDKVIDQEFVGVIGIEHVQDMDEFIEGLQ